MRGVQRVDFFAVYPQPSRYADPVLPTHQGGRAVAHERIELWTILPADLDDVFEALVRYEYDVDTAALEESVRRHRRAVE